MRNGDLKAEDYARALLERAQHLESLNAFRRLDKEMVLEAARAADKARACGDAIGALHGLPIPVKDSVNSKALRQAAKDGSGSRFSSGLSADDAMHDWSQLICLNDRGEAIETSLMAVGVASVGWAQRCGHRQATPPGREASSVHGAAQP